MSITWKRVRPPDEVPTPVAVAVSDYCRRSKRPAPPAEVREALSALGEDEDFRVRELTDAEAVVSGLGPFALVDVVRGSDPELCARRQEVGYYDLVREMLSGAAEPTLTTAPEIMPELQRTAALPAPRPAERKSEKPAEPTVQERIAPKKRSPSLPSADLDDLPSLTSGKKELPTPRGRYRQLEPLRRHLDELFAEPGKEMLDQILTQARHRVEVRDALARDFQPPHGRPITLTDVDSALETHGLLESMLKEERVQLARLYREHRGGSGRVAWALGLSTGDLTRLVKAHEKELHLDDLRESYRREALAPSNLAARLDLLGRTRYLADLGLAGKFEKALSKDLRALLQKASKPGMSTAERIDAAARSADVPRELLARAVDKLKVIDPNDDLPSSKHAST